MGCCGGGDTGAGALRAEEARRQQNINEGLTEIEGVFSGFNPAFYRGREQAYINYALPQLGRQAREAQRKAVYGLGDRGLLQSSAARTLMSNLGYETNLQKQNIADEGTRQAQELRRAVEQGRSQVVAQLEASANPLLAKQQAFASASQFNAPSIFQPLGNLFQNFSTLYLANRLNQAYAPLINAARGAGVAPPITGQSYAIRR